MIRQRANALGDYASFFTHFGLITAVSVGAFAVLGFPPVLSILAGGAALGIKLGLAPMLKDSLQEAINSQKKNGGRDPILEGVRERMRNSLRRSGLEAEIERLVPQEKEHHSTQRRVESWVRDFSKRLGLKKAPQTLVMPERDNLADRINDTTLKGSIGKELLREFNKYANAFAFSHNKDNVVFTDRLVQTLDPQEVKGVVAHEVGHIAAKHSALRETMGLFSMPARFLVTFNNLFTMFSSIKNAGIYIMASAMGRFCAERIAQFAELDKDVKSEKATIDTIKKVATHASLAGLSVTLGAPEILAAQALSLATNQALTLLERSNSRHNEFQADRIAAQLTQNPEAMCSALHKIRRENLKVEKGFDYSDPSQEKGVLSSLFDRVKDLYKTHPNVERRCEALMNVRITVPPARHPLASSGAQLNDMILGYAP